MKTGIEWDPKNSIDTMETQLEEIRELGYDCVDFQSLADTDSVFYKGGAAARRKLASKVRKAAENAGIIISQTHGPWRWPPRDFTESDRAERFEKMTTALELTAEAGCADMVIHPIMPYGCDQDPEPERFLDMNREFFSRLIAEARKTGVVVDFENMPMPALRLASPAQIADFVREFDTPYFRVCLDTGHSIILKTQPADAVRQTGNDLLRVLHVHDNNGVSDLHWLPETGVIDWQSFGAALRETGFDGVFSLETNVRPDGLDPAELREKRAVLAMTARRLANG